MTKYFFVLIATITSSILFSSCKKEKSVLAEAKFTFSGNLDAIPAQIQFTNNSFGISYIWDFGDGTSSNEKNPIHTYNEYGLYKVKLTAKGSNNIDTIVKDLLIGGNLGQIGGLNCSNSTSTTKFKIGESYTDAIVSLPYTNGNGGVYNRLIINSTGVQGLTAKLSSGKFNSGDDNLEFLISGTPSSKGTAKFKIDLVGKSCELNVYVLDTLANLPMDGLVGWWPFNGNANDESGNGKNLKLYGDASFAQDRFSKNNSAITLDGNDDYVSSINSLLNFSNDFTISIWFSVKSPTSNGCIFNSFPSHVIEYWNYQSTQTSVGKNSAGFIGNGSSWYGQPTIEYNMSLNTNSWHNWVIVKNNNLRKIYLDNKLISQINTIFYAQNILSGVMFGAHCGGGATPDGEINGSFDDIGIWNRALTQQEITDLYNLK